MRKLIIALLFCGAVGCRAMDRQIVIDKAHRLYGADLAAAYAVYYNGETREILISKYGDKWEGIVAFRLVQKYVRLNNIRNVKPNDPFWTE